MSACLAPVGGHNRAPCAARDDMSSPKENPLQRLYSRPGFLLRRAHQISVAIFESECSSIGLTPAQYSVLSVLRSNDGLDQTRLAKALGFDKVTTLRVLYLMEERRLIERTRSETDKRTNSLRLTREGIALYQQAQKPVERAYKRLMEPLSPDQQQQFLGLLEHVVQALDSHARAPLVRDIGTEPALTK